MTGIMFLGLAFGLIVVAGTLTVAIFSMVGPFWIKLERTISSPIKKKLGVDE
jgi:hypothetical protein